MSELRKATREFEAALAKEGKEDLRGLAEKGKKLILQLAMQEENRPLHSRGSERWQCFVR